MGYKNIMITKKSFKQVRAELLMLDVTQQQIAKKFYVSRQLVGQYLKGQHNSETANKVRQYVAKLINRNPWKEEGNLETETTKQ